MKTTTALLGAICSAVLGCGDDGGNATMNTSSPVGTGDCNKGAYPGDHDTLKLCGKNAVAECADGKPIDVIRGYTSYAWDIETVMGDEPDLSALSCLQSVGELSIYASNELLDLHGLEQLEQASGVSILKNKKLTSLRGLSGVTSTVELAISSNDVLTHIEGLAPSLSVRRLTMYHNPLLTSLSGLEGLAIDKLISIENNDTLPSCEVARFAALYPGVELDSSGNLGAGCP